MPCDMTREIRYYNRFSVFSCSFHFFRIVMIVYYPLNHFVNRYRIMYRSISVKENKPAHAVNYRPAPEPMLFLTISFLDEQLSYLFHQGYSSYSCFGLGRSHLVHASEQKIWFRMPEGQGSGQVLQDKWIPDHAVWSSLKGLSVSLHLSIYL